MMTKETVAENFKNGIDCGQVVAGQFEEETGYTLSQLRKMSACYAAGMMRGETCGAVLAAYNVIGLIYGHDEEGGDVQKGQMLQKMLRFNELFGEKYSQGFQCKELLGADISTSEGGKKINEENLLFNLCPAICCDVVEVLKKVISE